MLLLDAPLLDVRPMLVQERAHLVARLRSLGRSRWMAATALPGWTVKDIALHLLDDDLGRLSRDRDGDTSGLIAVDSYPAFVEALNAKNQRWVKAAGGLSRELVAELLAWSGLEIDSWLAGVDLHADATVAWASDTAVPMWFDLAREFTESWIHHQQLLDALGEHDEHLNATADVVLDTFVWAYPTSTGLHHPPERPSRHSSDRDRGRSLAGRQGGSSTPAPLPMPTRISYCPPTRHGGSSPAATSTPALSCEMVPITCSNLCSPCARSSCSRHPVNGAAARLADLPDSQSCFTGDERDDKIVTIRTLLNLDKLGHIDDVAQLR